jgi:hypothetical protein
MAVAICPFCDKKIHVAEDFADSRMTCPRCGDSVRIPWVDETAGNAASGGSVGIEAADHLPLSARYGVAALALGLTSVIIMCVPVVGYGSLGLSGIGILLSLWGLIRSLREGNRWFGLPRNRGVEMPDLLGGCVLSFPLAGTLLCSLTLTLALLPFMIR